MSLYPARALRFPVGKVLTVRRVARIARYVSLQINRWSEFKVIYYFSITPPAVKDVLAQENPAKSHMKVRPAAVKRPCQLGLQYCPIYGKWSGGSFIKNYECMDVQHDLESCGGCVHNDSLDGDVNRSGGRDCSLIPGVDTVRCVQGRCVIGESTPVRIYPKRSSDTVDKCSWGYSISVDKSSCESLYGKDF
jgi:hypothetical protein